MAYNYCVTAHKPTTVTHAITGNFTSPTDRNLVVAKCTRLEIHLLTPDGLQPLVDVPIYGRISVLNFFRPQGEAKDLLFLVTERYKMCVLEYDSASGELITRASGDVQDRIGRPTENGQIGIVDPEARMLGLHLYDGLFKVIPVGSRNSLVREAFNIRLEEPQVLDLKFLHCTQRPTIAVLYQDQKEARHVKTYEIIEKDKDFGEGPWQASNVDGGSSLIIPVPAPYGGAIVIGEQTVVYMNVGLQKATASRAAMIRAYGRVDADGSRYLLGDITGTLWLLALLCEGSSVQGLKLEPLGQTSSPSALAYLDSGVLYVGSSTGDSQLVRLHSQADASGSYVEPLETFVGLGPIVNFAVVDLDRQGQGQVVTCSGLMRDGSLRVVRNGIGINEQATVELPGVKGLWALKTDAASAHDAFLVVSFISETRLLAMNMEDELDETEIPGFECSSQTLLCASVAHGQLLQVTPGAVRLVSAGTLQLLTTWNPPAAHAVTVAAADADQVLVALGGGHLVHIRIGQGSLTEERHAQLEHEISCVDVVRFDESKQTVGEGAMTLAVVGLWNTALRILSVPSLELVREEHLGSEAIPRSVMMVSFEGVSYLLAGLGDGQLYSFVADPCTGALTERRKVSLGTQPVTLRPFTSKGAVHVFACSDRPTVIYGASRKLMYSNVNLREVTHMCCFNSASFPDSLAVASKSALTIGTIDDIQKLHIRTIPLGEQPRRIAHQEASRTFAVCCTRLTPSAENGEEFEAASVRLLDDTTFETLSVFALDRYESPCSLCSLQFGEDARHYYAVGTAYALPEEMEPTKGRILVFHVDEGKLVVVVEKEAKGAVYNLNAFNGKLLAGINSKLMLYRWTQREDDTRELVNECGHHGHIMALYVAVRGDFILVGDLMRSMSLVIYKPEEGALEERARDINANWMSAVEILDDDTFLGAENAYNLFVCRKNADAASDDERARLEVVGEFHLGEFVNTFRRGSLVMRAADSELGAVPTMLYGTQNGVIGVLAQLPQAQFALLARVQSAMCEVVRGVGGLSWAAWRSFSNERRTAEARNFIDGDLIESFLDLKPEQMAEVAARVDTPLEELVKRVEELTRLH